MRITSEKIQDPILRMIGKEADRLGLECYVIGGWVRDLILHRPSTDIDVVVAKGPSSLSAISIQKADVPV